MKRCDTPSREDMMNFSLLIESLVKESGSNYLEAVTEYCSDNDIDFEVAASLIDQNLKFKMFAKNISNEDYSEVCEIYHNSENINLLNHSRELIARYDLCDFFQNYFEIDLPILIDNASEITTEISKFYNRKKATLLVANYESLKITPTAL